MSKLVKLRIKKPKRIMREIVAAVLLDQLNIDQAAERYKLNRLTVLRWIRKVEEEAKASKQTTSIASDQPCLPTRKSTRRSIQEEKVKQLRTKLQSLEKALERPTSRPFTIRPWSGWLNTIWGRCRKKAAVARSVTKPSGLC